TYDHRTLKTKLPVRSASFKQRTGGLVVRWVTTGEFPLLYVFLPLIRILQNHFTGPVLVSDAALYVLRNFVKNHTGYLCVEQYVHIPCYLLICYLKEVYRIVRLTTEENR
ncbi:hypothetical protein GQ44DRAFT_670521, partial [Phaeosphaeriaceae sp. PMI808]